MKKYKLSEGNFTKFLNFFGLGTSQRPKTIDDLINSDPRLAKLDKEMGELNKQAGIRIKNNPHMLAMFKKVGVEIG
jgi:hypothetical protein